jgi:hypothetical protein
MNPKSSKTYENATIKADRKKFVPPLLIPQLIRAKNRTDSPNTRVDS